MDYLYNILPKDLVYIIDDYAKDRTNYNKVMNEFTFLSYRYRTQCNCGFVCKLYPSLYILRGIKTERECNIEQWYLDNKKMKRPHGKRPPTIHSSKVRKRKIGKKRNNKFFNLGRR